MVTKGVELLVTNANDYLVLAPFIVAFFVGGENKDNELRWKKKQRRVKMKQRRVRRRLRFHAGEQEAGEKMTTKIAIGYGVKKKMV
ncbi:hypothetical protein HID58_024533 [Brassica napus]|uniref:Uncharacterized protein n=2 Tax=Brassica napus TaxID=3708 RepID=A0ABQ7XGD2_BRANA|nr:hypothetical protein HID58_024533 [Brassica napus]